MCLRARGLTLAAGQAAGRTSPGAAGKVEEQRNSIHVEVNLVGVIASVLDKNNRPAPDLTRDQFEIYEEGKPQKIEVFEPQTQQPIDLALDDGRESQRNEGTAV